MNRKPLRGVLLLGIGRGAEGMAQFESTVAAFTTSLAPLLAFPVLMFLSGLVQGQIREAVAVLLLTAVIDLSPSVLSHILAVRWQREAEWMRYATALNWCRGMIQLASLAALLLLGGGAPNEQVLEIVVFAVFAYVLWLNWLVARHGLALGAGRAVLLVLGVTIGTGLLVFVPQMVALAVNGIPPELAATATGPNGSGPNASGPNGSGL